MDLAPAKTLINTYLARTPRVYAKIIRLKKRYNKEKYTYLNLIKEGDTVIEGGANVGYFTKLFAQIVGRPGDLHAFEPTPSTFKILELNCAQARLPHFPKLNCHGLSDKEDAAIIHVPEGDSGQASLIPHSVGSWKNQNTSNTQKIKLTTLDEYSRLKAFKKIDFLKLDIEGAELLALKGALNTLKAFQPIIHMEVCSHFLKDFGAKVSDLTDLLENLGYDRFLAYEENIQKPRDLRSISDEELQKSMNVICACSNIHHDRLKRMHWA